MLMAACDPIGYRLLGFDEHASCEENMRGVMEGFGYDRVDVPTHQTSSRTLLSTATARSDTSRRRPSRATTSFCVRELDCYFVLTACPQDVVPINDMNPTSLARELLE